MNDVFQKSGAAGLPAPSQAVSPAAPGQKTASGSGEDRLLAILDGYFPNPDRLRGDDCAVLAAEGPRVVSSDVFFEDVHFRRAYFSLEETGHKALAVNISDIAAMGAKPLRFSLGLGLPPDMDAAQFGQLCAGMAALARQYDITLIGGDLSAADKLLLSITIEGGCWPEIADASAGAADETARAASQKASRQAVGQAAQQAAHQAVRQAIRRAASHAKKDTAAHGPHTGFLRRGAAQPGDAVFYSGSIGLARAGLNALETLQHTARSQWPEACAAHLTPAPRVEDGRAIALLAARSGQPQRFGLMDVSDGLARDLPRLTGGRGVEIYSAAVPLPQEAVRYARLTGRDPLRECLLGGEDYALAGTCPPFAVEPLRELLPHLVFFGQVTDAPGLSIDGEPFQASGFDHFGA